MAHFLTPLLAETRHGWSLRIKGTERIVATSLEPAFDPTARNRGLLGRDGLAPGAALVLAPCSSVHTFFMRFAIAVIYCDRQGTVLKCVPELRPWRVSGVLTRGFAVIELASGARDLPRVGDVIEVISLRT